MSSSKDKEVQVSDELKQLGFDKFSISLQGKNLMVWHNGNVIISSFDKYDLAKSIRSLTKKFEEKEIDQKSIQLFTTYLTEEYLKLKDLSNPPSNSYEDEEEQDTNRIIDETKKIKSNNSGITF